MNFSWINQKTLVPKPTKHNHLLKFQSLVLHPNFDHVGNFIAVINAVTLSIEIAIYPDREENKNESDEATAVIKKLRIFNVIISFYYLFEQVSKVKG